MAREPGRVLVIDEHAVGQDEANAGVDVRVRLTDGSRPQHIAATRTRSSDSAGIDPGMHGRGVGG